MDYNVNQINPRYDFIVSGASYKGNPKCNTAMFITKKVERLLGNLSGVQECLVFAEDGIIVPSALEVNNCFVMTQSPQLDYARFANELAQIRTDRDKALRYQLTEQGYYLSETAQVGENAYIEPGRIIGHDVILGKNATILAGTVIKNAVSGDNFLANEKAVIGAKGFTMAEDESGNKMRIATLGKVLIGNRVEVGALDNISCGSGGDTVLEDNVKVDALVHIGHDVHLGKDTEITAGSIIGGFVETGLHAYIGINACIRNRIQLGEGCVVGMGSTVTKTVEAGVTVAGNPARRFEKKDK